MCQGKFISPTKVKCILWNKKGGKIDFYILGNDKKPRAKAGFLSVYNFDF